MSGMNECMFFGCVKQAGLCGMRIPYRSCGTEHALTVPMGLVTALVTGEVSMVLVALDLFVMLKDKQHKPWFLGCYSVNWLLS